MTKNWFQKLFRKEDECLCHGTHKNLSEAEPGRRLRIECLRGEAGVCERLREMGFCESAEVEKISDSGALICKVCDAKVILSKGLAKSVIVKDICACEGHAGHPGHTLGIPEHNAMLLSQMRVGQKGTIQKFNFDGDGSERIEEMGLTSGETVEVIRYAPLGDPIEIKVRGYMLSLRKQEADRIIVSLSS